MILNSGRLLNERVKTHPHKIAIITKSERLDFLRLNQRANRLAHVLAGQGVKCNDKVGILFPNSPEFVVAYLAVQKVGGVTVPLDAKLPSKDIEAVLDFADARLLVTLPSAESTVDIKQPVVTVEKEQIKCKGD